MTESACNGVGTLSDSEGAWLRVPRTTRLGHDTRSRSSSSLRFLWTHQYYSAFAYDIMAILDTYTSRHALEPCEHSRQNITATHTWPGNHPSES